jgi:hypothetical protein
MSKLPRGINVNENNSLCFGNYRAKDKIKVDNFEHMGNLYSLRSHHLVTRLEKNGELLIESVPGATFTNFTTSETGYEFEVSGLQDGQITLGLAPETPYTLQINACGNPSAAATNRSGKLSFSIELSEDPKKVVLTKA